MKIDHITINVSDLDRSTKFYCEGLHCQHLDDQYYDEPEDVNTSTVQGQFRVHSRYLSTENGMMLILNLTEIPAEPLPPYRRQYGLTNIAVSVANIDNCVTTLERLGGTVVQGSRQSFPTDNGKVDVIVLLDPDGQPVELIAKTSSP